MTDHEALRLIVKFTELRMNPLYQAAERKRRHLGAEVMARSEATSEEYAAVVLLIGTWERIAIFAKEFSPTQKRRFFRCSPVGLVWSALEPAITCIRTAGVVSEAYASELEALALEYRAWTLTDGGSGYRTEVQQAICAMFA
jgi:hypothetical protein